MTAQPEMRLADDISAQFRHLPIGQAAEVIANHIRTFWDPRMRAQLIEQVGAAGIHCDSHVAAAVRLLRNQP
jgi:formate dehydrogenase subunit delta